MGSRKAAANTFIDHMRSSNELHEQYLSDSLFQDRYVRFTQWQLAFVLSHFGDLADRRGYAEAINFTVSDFAGISVSARDAEAARAAPFFTKLLPLGALQALSAAGELNARSLSINLDVCRILSESLENDIGPSVLDYAYAYRDVTTLDECAELIGLMEELGHKLKGLVGMPFIGLSLKTMHGPAHALGFGALQDFLENGFKAFKQIPDVDYFLTEVGQRMLGIFTFLFEASDSELVNSAETSH